MIIQLKTEGGVSGIDAVHSRATVVGAPRDDMLPIGAGNKVGLDKFKDQLAGGNSGEGFPNSICTLAFLTSGPGLIPNFFPFFIALYRYICIFLSLKRFNN